MAIPNIRIVPGVRNTVMVIDDQTTGRAILGQIARNLEEKIDVHAFEQLVEDRRTQQLHPRHFLAKHEKLGGTGSAVTLQAVLHAGVAEHVAVKVGQALARDHDHHSVLSSFFH